MWSSPIFTNVEVGLDTVLFFFYHNATKKKTIKLFIELMYSMQKKNVYILIK
jgi:hypothetical protein